MSSIGKKGQITLPLSSSLEPWLRGAPTSAAQQAVLAMLARAVEPLCRTHRLPAYELCAGTRLKRLWGQCRHFRDGRPPLVLVRCTGQGEPACWRRAGAIVATLLHELAHLRDRHHGPRFWALYRCLLDEAAAAGVYDPGQDDPEEHSCGDEKLAGSAADALAQAARSRRRERAEANRQAARQWTVGMEGRVALEGGPLARARVRVVAVARGWLTVERPDGAVYRVAGTVLRPL
ncbi:MAG: M48 family metallopeptidase [Chloroflexi bacterium]|nr:M48 family metallopeptidase [Chloroflexota bacterium]